ncbi:cold-shock protein [Stieleria varia]
MRYRFRPRDSIQEKVAENYGMEGKIKRLTDKGFGFIESGSDKDMFFHSSALQGVRYDDLREGQEVTYDVGQGPKGPRAENVQLKED